MTRSLRETEKNFNSVSVPIIFYLCYMQLNPYLNNRDRRWVSLNCQTTGGLWKRLDTGKMWGLSQHRAAAARSNLTPRFPHSLVHSFRIQNPVREYFSAWGNVSAPQRHQKTAGGKIWLSVSVESLCRGRCMPRIGHTSTKLTTWNSLKRNIELLIRRGQGRILDSQITSKYPVHSTYPYFEWIKAN